MIGAQEPIEVPFGDYLPDLPDYKNPGATVAKNVIPDIVGYLPLGQLEAVTGAINARCRGAWSFRDKDANVYNIAGDETKLYSEADGSFSDVSKMGGYSTGTAEFWSAVKWGEKVIATNFTDNMQIFTLGGANFADLTGSPPKARHISVVGQFVVVGNLNESSTLYPNRVRWSGINDETQWATSSDKQSDFQDLYSSAAQGGGWIMGITGGEYGLIFQEYAVWRMEYIGSPAVFQFDEILPGVGTPARNSIVQFGEQVFFLGQDGFYRIVNGSTVESIGADKIDKTFLDDLDNDNIERVIGAADPSQKIVMWIYPGSGNTGGRPNKAVIYDWFNKKWTSAEFECEWVYSGLGAGYTIDSLDNLTTDIDSLATSLDSRAFTGGALQLAAFDENHKKATFTGTALDATLETVEAQLNKMGRANVTGVRPMVDGSPTLTVQMAARNKQDESYSFGSTSSPHSDTNIAPFRSDGRYHRARVNTSGNFNHAIGCQAFAVPSSGR